MSKSFYVIQTNSMFKHFYVVPTNEVDGNNLQSYIDQDALREFSQQHEGEQIVRVDEMNQDDVLELFDKNNDYLVSWSQDQKLAYIHNWQESEINYDVNYDELTGGQPFNGIAVDDLLVDVADVSITLTDSSAIQWNMDPQFVDEMQLTLDLSNFKD